MAMKRDKYLGLVRRFPLRPLRSEKDLDRAIKVMDLLIDRPALGTEERDYLDVLSDLVGAYEEEHHPMPKVSDARMLRHLLEARGVSQTEVARATGIVNSTISAVLKGGRQLTRDHIGRLASYFSIEPGVFIFGESEPLPAKRSRRSRSLPSQELVKS
jgi:HTH-type transcriptional regulator/antitoxin HigA